MSCKSNFYRLSDVIEIIGGGTPKRSNPIFWGGNISWLSVVDFNSDNRFVHRTVECITEDGLNHSSTKLLSEDDLIISARGTVGCLGQLKKPMAFNQSCYGLRAKSEYLENDYLYYLLKTKINELKKKTHGAVFDTITRETFNHIEVRIPEAKNVREHISKILGDLDRKIELNTQTNQTLEAMAQALFTSWFVDFDPVKAKMAVLAAGGSAKEAEIAAMGVIAAKSPEAVTQLQQTQPEEYAKLAETAALFPSSLQASKLGEIPAGWGAASLGVFVEIKRGGSPRPIRDFVVSQGYPWTKIADATANNNPYIFKTNECIKEEGLRKTVLLKKGALILSNSATPGLPRFLDLDACIHDGWLYFPKKEKLTDTFLYFLFVYIRKDLIMQGNGSVFTNLKIDIIKNQLVIIPSASLISIFDELAGSLLELIRNKSRESNKLSTFRDTLLPKLLSGEIDLQNLPTENQL